MKGRIERIQGQPGMYAFFCPCGYTKRRVTDSEVFFSCERPVEPKVPACSTIHHLAEMKEALDNREKRKDAEAFIESHDEKLAEARAVIAATEPENPRERTTVRLPKKKKGV